MEFALTVVKEHPIAVASLIATLGAVSDIATLQAAILHDTVEDTDTSIIELEAKFGKLVASVVAEVCSLRDASELTPLPLVYR